MRVQVEITAEFWPQLRAMAEAACRTPREQVRYIMVQELTRLFRAPQACPEAEAAPQEDTMPDPA